MRKIDFSKKKIKILLLTCSIKIVNLWKTVLVIPVYGHYSLRLLFLTKEKKIPLSKISHFPH